MSGIGLAKKGLGLLGKKKKIRTKAEMIERIRQLDPKIYGEDIPTFGSGVEKKQMKKIFSKGDK